jgi:hypothetical protein
MASQGSFIPLPRTIENPITLGLNIGNLAYVAGLDTAISEFSRFYLERRAQEVEAAGSDLRKRKKLEDEFTPRIEMTLVGATGNVHRRLTVRARYRFDSDFDYVSTLSVTPSMGTLADTPALGRCTKSGRTIPKTCLGRCQIMGADVFRHLLVQSDIGSRLALPEGTILCSLTGKRVLKDEVELSAVSGQPVIRTLLKKSALSGKRAEPSHFEQCHFTKSEFLDTELATSDVSGKRYRIDEALQSVVAGKVGHKSEFLMCYETRQPVTISEAEQCDVTGSYVRLGVLEQCAVSQKRVLPSELERCAATGKRVLKKLLVTSSLSEARIREDIALQSSTGKFCSPLEARICLWTGRGFHPDDLRVCALTGLTVHFEFITTREPHRLRILVDLLDGIKRTTDQLLLWDEILVKASNLGLKGRSHIESAATSPSGQHLAVCVEIRTLFGLRVYQAGIVYSIGDHSVVGRLVQGRRTAAGWS